MTSVSYFYKMPKMINLSKLQIFLINYSRISRITRHYHLSDFFDTIMCKKYVKTSPNLIKTNQMQQTILFFFSTLYFQQSPIAIQADLGSWKKYFKFLIGDTLIFWRKNCRVYQGGWLSPIWSLKSFSDSQNH